MAHFELTIVENNTTQSHVLSAYDLSEVTESSGVVVLFLTLTENGKNFVFRLFNDTRADLSDIKEFILGELRVAMSGTSIFKIRVEDVRYYIYIGEETEDTRCRQFSGSMIEG